jgi:hypothetical protein
MTFNWHSGPITRDTPLDKHYRHTQKVRAFMTAQCGEAFTFDRPFMAWVKASPPSTMGEMADEWNRLQGCQGTTVSPSGSW